MFRYHRKRREYYKNLFLKIYSPFIPRITALKRKYGFFEKHLYIIKEHRTKQSEKINEVLHIATDVFNQVKANESFISKNVLKHYFAIQELSIEQTDRDNMPLKTKLYFESLTNYKLKQEMLFMLKAFFEDMKTISKRANVLYSDLEQTLAFLSEFVNHLEQNELVLLYKSVDETK